VSASAEPSLGTTARHVGVAVLWLAAFRLLSEHGVRLVPLALAQRLTLQAYLTGVQLVVLGLGLAFAFVLLPAPRQALGFEMPRAARLLPLLFAAPALYVVASYAAIYAALPTLLAELAARGRQAVQESSGQFGRELVASGLGLAVLWGVVVSPLAEELMFRGGLWSAAQSVVDLVRGRLGPEQRPPASTDLPEGVIQPSALLSALRGVGRFFGSGGGTATLVSATVFAAMHADLPGGLGIVRWVSALGLALGTGLARQLSGGILAPIALHVVFNACSLATTRRWLVSESFGQKLGVPVLLSLIAAVSALVAVGLALALRARRAPSS